MGKIFVNYRREISQADARQVRDILNRRFGRRNVFFDVSSLAKGARFDLAIDQAIVRSDAMLVVIGPGWLTVADSDGAPRLFAKDDFIRFEIERALYHNKRILPLLLDDAPMPSADELPESIRGLARWNAAEARHATFEKDLDEVARHLKAMIGSGEVGLRWIAAAAGLALAAGLGAGVALDRSGAFAERTDMRSLRSQLDEMTEMSRRLSSDLDRSDTKANNLQATLNTREQVLLKTQAALAATRLELTTAEESRDRLSSDLALAEGELLRARKTLEKSEVDRAETKRALKEIRPVFEAMSAEKSTLEARLECLRSALPREDWLDDALGPFPVRAIAYSDKKEEKIAHLQDQVGGLKANILGFQSSWKNVLAKTERC